MPDVEKSLEVMSRALMWGSGLCLISMMVHVGLDVGSKFLMSRPIPGTPEIVARYYMLGVVFLPLPLIEMRNNAIVVDLFYGRFRPALQRFCTAVAYNAQSVFFGLLAYRSFWDAIDSFLKREFIDGQVPIVVWPATFFLPFGFALAALVSLLRLAQTLTREDWAQCVEPRSSYDGEPAAQEGI